MTNNSRQRVRVCYVKTYAPYVGCVFAETFILPGQLSRLLSWEEFETAQSEDTLEVGDWRVERYMNDYTSDRCVIRIFDGGDNAFTCYMSRFPVPVTEMLPGELVDGMSVRVTPLTDEVVVVSPTIAEWEQEQEDTGDEDEESSSPIVVNDETPEDPAN